MRGSQWLIKIHILYVIEIKIIQKIIFKLTIKCKCRDYMTDVTGGGQSFGLVCVSCLRRQV